MKLRKARSRKRGRIEVIPMIDVMFFLLATFMLASLSLQNLHSLAVDLPRGNAEPLTTKKSVTLTITRTGDILLNEISVTLDTLTSALQSLMAGPDTAIVIAADNAAPSGVVVQAMLRARAAGAEHFLFAVKHE